MEALLTLAIPALVKLFDEANHKNWNKVGLILLAAIGGAAVGFVTGGVNGIIDGIFYIGLPGAGIVTVAGKVKPTVVKPTVIEPTEPVTITTTNNL